MILNHDELLKSMQMYLQLLLLLLHAVMMFGETANDVSGALNFAAIDSADGADAAVAANVDAVC